MRAAERVSALGSGGRVRVLRFVVGPLRTNMYLVYDEGSRDSILVDVGGDPSGALELVERLGLNLRGVLTTHGHFDHVIGLAKLGDVGAPRYIHREDLWVVELSVGWYSRYFGERVEAPRFDALVEGDCELRLGSLGVCVLHTPGHTPGSLVIYVPGAGALLTGDTLFAGTVGRTDLPGGSQELLERSLRKIYERVPLDTAVYPGHGPSTTLRRELAENPVVREVLRGPG